MYRNARVPLFLSLRPGREVIIEGGGASVFCALSLSFTGIKAHGVLERRVNSRGFII